MIGYVFLGVCLLIALILAGRILLTMNPAQLANILRFTFVGLLGSAAIFLMITGRFAIGAGLALFSVSLLKRWSFPTITFPNLGRGKSKQQSTVETGFLRMNLEHESGVMQGEVLQGTYAGRDLARLNLNQLLVVLAECERTDPEAAQLLETYLDRTQENWREQASQDEQAQTGTAGQGWGRRRQPNRSSSPMSVDEACEVLGVEPGATEEEIKAAHHRLMLNNHPDRGGSDFLAAKINQAKDILLGT